MSDEKGKVTDKASEIAKNIWLAGVGAYGKAAGEAQDRLEKAGVETPKLFKDLVKAGAALEEEARENLKPLRDTSSSVEDRINRVRENFSLHLTGRSEEINKLNKKVDKLAKQIDALSAALAEQGFIKTPATRKKPAAKKKTVVKKKGVAAKKAPAKKTAAKKKTTAARKKS